MNRIASPQNRQGHTLVNIVVVFAILAVLAALVLPAVQQAREKARRSQCRNNLKQIGLSLMNYHDVHRAFPPGVVVAQTQQAVGGNHLGWVFHTLPFYDSSPLFSKFNSKLDITATGPDSNSEMAGVILACMRCPSDSGPDQHPSGSFEGQLTMGTSKYVGNFGVGYPSLNMHPEDCQGIMGPNSNFRIRVSVANRVV